MAGAKQSSAEKRQFTEAGRVDGGQVVSASRLRALALARLVRSIIAKLDRRITDADAQTTQDARQTERRRVYGLQQNADNALVMATKMLFMRSDSTRYHFDI